MRGLCHNDQPLECTKCCLSPAGDYMPDCDCEEWTHQCEEHVYNMAKSVATAKIDGSVDVSTASCSGTLKNELLQDAEQTFDAQVRHNALLSVLEHLICLTTPVVNELSRIAAVIACRTTVLTSALTSVS